MAETETKKQRVRLSEDTPPQTVSMITSWGGILSQELPTEVSYNTYRAIRKDPTVALARETILSMILSGSWAIEKEKEVDEDKVLFIRDQILPMRENILTHAVSGMIDYGWQGFEKIFEEKKGKIVVSSLKPLLQDLTEIMVDEKTGAYRGFRQMDRVGGDYIKLTVDKALLFSIGVEGTQWYGQGLLENIRSTVTNWNTVNEGATAYDRKVAGAHFVVYYPMGKSKVQGITKDNGEVARDILTALEHSGSITIPNNVAEYLDQLNNASGVEALSWRVEILEDQGNKQPTFIERAKYLDTLKVRGLTMLERAITEGTFGTKAEAGAHIDVAIMNMQKFDRYVVRILNEQLVNQLLLLNYGEEWVGKVRLSPAPLIDDQITFFRDIYRILLSNPNGFLEVFAELDIDSISDKLSLPETKDKSRREELIKNNPSFNKPAPPPGISAEELNRMKSIMGDNLPEKVV